MLNKELNIREDEFGTNKLKMISMIINGIREILPSDLILDVRISLIDGLISEESELAYKSLLIEQLVELEIDMISISNGIYDINKQLIYPLKNWGHGVFIKKIIPFAERYPHIIWNASGNIWDIDELDLEKLPHNLTFSMGRALIADPSFIAKSLSGHKLSINHCERKNQCHYYSLGKKNITCPIYETSKN
jgi:2,4-dienoyl-CoA reductase-like NADH-dependent reductase (Old Yellow Enzyme family)